MTLKIDLANHTHGFHVLYFEATKHVAFVNHGVSKHLCRGALQTHNRVAYELINNFYIKYVKFIVIPHKEYPHISRLSISSNTHVTILGGMTFWFVDAQLYFPKVTPRKESLKT